MLSMCCDTHVVIGFDPAKHRWRCRMLDCWGGIESPLMHDD